MIRLLSTLLLFVYTLTSTGATVYYHACGQNATISLTSERAEHSSCSFCQHTKGHVHDDSCAGDSEITPRCCSPEDACCTDVQLELKTNEEQLTNAQLIKDLSAFTTPAIALIPWILTHYQAGLAYSPFQVPHATQNTLHSNTPPVYYLIHGNFRI